MKRSTERILTTHAGSLPRPEGLREIVVAKGTGQPYDEGDLSRRLRSGVADVVRLQIESGLDIVNDGELSKPSFTDYARERIGGLEKREMSPEARPAQAISGRDQREFPEYFASRVQVGAGFDPIFCSGPFPTPARLPFKQTSTTSTRHCKARARSRHFCPPWRREP